MKYLKPLNEGKSVDLEKEQQNQAMYKEKLTTLETSMSELEGSDKKEFEKMMEKSKMLGTKAKLYGELAKSFQKEGQLMMAVAQEKKTE